MKIFYTFLVTVIFSSSLTVLAGTDIQNGGGGIKINGKVATFYNAEMQINPEPISSSDVFSQLSFNIQMLPIPGRVKVELIGNILPSFQRKYYSVTRESINPAVLDKIKSEYHNATNVPVENLTIFALTDSKTKTTLLLPDFNLLTPNEQSAILLHESLWINNRVKTYEKMLKIEKSAQIYSRYPDDCMALYNFVMDLESAFNERLWGVHAAFQCEMKTYMIYSKILTPRQLVVPFKDFVDLPTINTFSQIMLASNANAATSESVQALLADQLLSESNTNIFLISKLALSNELKNGETLQGLLDAELSDRLKTIDSKSPEGIQAVSKLLQNSYFMLDDDGFTLYLPHFGTFYLLSN